MNIALVGVAYKDYGRFLPQWCRFISEMTTKPDQVVVVLGYRHGCSQEDLELARSYVPELEVHINLKLRTMGKARNAAVAKTRTEWVQYLSIDDQILPWAIEEFASLEADADYICIQWLTRGLGCKEMLHVSPLPRNMATKHSGRGFIIGHSPFRRSFWEKTPYENHDYPNAPFVAGVVQNHGRFVQSTRPCTVYLRRPDSHARSVLPNPNEKAQARAHKRRMEQAIDNYYRGR